MANNKLTARNQCSFDSITDRFMSHVEKVTESGCWIWMGLLNDKGYGIFWTKERARTRAHRFAYETYVGPFPDGLEPDHLCRIRCCVNPRHLDPVTRRVNLNRGINHESTRTHCPKGHPYDEKNTYHTRKVVGFHIAREISFRNSSLIASRCSSMAGLING